MHSREGSPDGRELTLTERARRAQLIEVTIEVVADQGYAGASLAAIAARADLTKAAVLYHYPSKAAVVQAAYEHVLGALVAEVAAAVETAGPAQGPAAYIRSMVGHLRRYPRHTRMIIEAISHGLGDQDPQARWRALADILHAARQANGAPEQDMRTAAVVIGGGINAIVAERLQDPDYDTAAAAEDFIAMVAPIWSGGGD